MLSELGVDIANGRSASDHGHSLVVLGGSGDASGTTRVIVACCRAKAQRKSARLITC
jgi:hypothetical protein